MSTIVHCTRTSVQDFTIVYKAFGLLSWPIVRTSISSVLYF
nr:MAG TPA: hypothetical protein [Caudoviricetes sp.]